MLHSFFTLEGVSLLSAFIFSLAGKRAADNVVLGCLQPAGNTGLLGDHHTQLTTRHCHCYTRLPRIGRATSSTLVAGLACLGRSCLKTDMCGLAAISPPQCLEWRGRGKWKEISWRLTWATVCASGLDLSTLSYPYPHCSGCATQTNGLTIQDVVCRHSSQPSTAAWPVEHVLRFSFTQRTPTRWS